ncbi:hypothetical protein HZC09_00530 [Candidatus Micrarchaeota archaeon]|nr:hypothetical protein [Candidatus Micrarchaeota archaeon]
MIRRIFGLHLMGNSKLVFKVQKEETKDEKRSAMWADVFAGAFANTRFKPTGTKMTELAEELGRTELKKNFLKRIRTERTTGPSGNAWTEFHLPLEDDERPKRGNEQALLEKVLEKLTEIHLHECDRVILSVR